jgi:hypothetical protein
VRRSTRQSRCALTHSEVKKPAREITNTHGEAIPVVDSSVTLGMTVPSVRNCQGIFDHGRSHSQLDAVRVIGDLLIMAGYRYNRSAGIEVLQQSSNSLASPYAEVCCSPQPVIGREHFGPTEKTKERSIGRVLLPELVTTVASTECKL